MTCPHHLAEDFRVGPQSERWLSCIYGCGLTKRYDTDPPRKQEDARTKPRFMRKR